MTLRSLIFPLLLVAAPAVGCSSNDDNNDTKDSGPAESGADGTPSMPCDEPESTDIAGTWALLAQYEMALIGQEGGAAGLCPKTQTSPARLLAVLDITAGSGEKYNVKALSCRLPIPSAVAMAGDCNPGGNPLTVNIGTPDAVTKSFATLDPVDTTAALTSSGLTFDKFGFAWGTRSENIPSWQPSRDGCKASDIEPGHTTECDTQCVEGCDRLVDDDNDEFPGLTFHLCGRTPDDKQRDLPCHVDDPTKQGVSFQGPISMALHSTLTLQGQARSSCEAAGNFSSDTAYKVVGSDVYIFGSRLAVSSVVLSLPLFDVVPTGSVWRMVRVDGKYGAPDWKLPTDGPGRCEQVLKKKNDLE